MLKTAVIGLGHPHIFSMIQEVLQENNDFIITAICDPDMPENVQKALEMVPNAHIYTNEDDLYKNEDFDVVLSSSVNGKKGKTALRALNAGKYIMFDKPLTTTKKELFEIEKILKDKPHLKIALWLTCRYEKGYYTVKKLIDAGEIGEVVHLYFVRPHRLAPESRPTWMFDPELYGGIINDIGVHDLDIARWYTSSEYVKILSATASNKRFLGYNIEDNGCVFAQMGSGADVMVFESWLTPDGLPAHGDTRVFVTGTKGTIELLEYPNEMVKLVSDTRAPEKVSLIAPDVTSVQDFALTMKKKSHIPLVSTHDAIMATRFALDAQELAKSIFI